MIYIGHAGTFGLFSDYFGSSTLSTYKKNFLFLARKVSDLIKHQIESGKCMLKIDNVDFVARPKNVRLHFGVPVAALVPEMHACAEHFFHAYSHVVTFGLG